MKNEMTLEAFEKRIEELKATEIPSREAVESLACVVEDEIGLLSWWVFDLKFGERFEHGCMLVGRKPVELYSVENIYNALREQYDFE